MMLPTQIVMSTTAKTTTTTTTMRRFYGCCFRSNSILYQNNLRVSSSSSKLATHRIFRTYELYLVSSSPSKRTLSSSCTSRGQHQIFTRTATTKNTKRKASTTKTTTTTSAETTTSTTVTTASLSEIPSVMIPNRIVSRRVWQQQYEKYQQSLLKDSSKNNPKASSTINKESTTTPWPKSIQVLGYITGFIVVPYMTIWAMVSNDMIRDEYLFPYLLPDHIQETLRRHYGNQDLHSISYCDYVQCRRDHNESMIPYKFSNEPNVWIRQQQKVIDREQNVSSRMITVRVHAGIHNSNHITRTDPTTSTTTSTILNNVPASMRVNDKTLQQLIQEAILNLSKYSSSKDISNTNDNMIQQKEFLSSLLLQKDHYHIGIDFPFNDHLPETPTMEINNDTHDDDVLTKEASRNLLDNKEDNALSLSQLNTYSLWHYQDPNFMIRQIHMDRSNDNNTSSSNTNQATISSNHKAYLRQRIEQLQYELIQLENDMKSGRSIDHILDEMNQKKRELRQLQYEVAWWKFW